MSSKRELMADPMSCWNKADMDEPLFVLRAQDILAPWVIGEWASMMLSLSSAVDPPPKAFSAYTVATEMRKWPRRKLPD
jgi:hypothetical protein